MCIHPVLQVFLGLLQEPLDARVAEPALLEALEIKSASAYEVLQLLDSQLWWGQIQSLMDWKARNPEELGPVQSKLRPHHSV